MSNHGNGKDSCNKEAHGAPPITAPSAAAAANGIHMQEHSCEICGMSGLSDDAMRDHTRQCHVEGSAQCPFCGLSGVPAAELLLHVNQAHLDYLTPENELMSFIDDQTPSIDGDSDSISDCRGLSPSITSELLTPVSNANSKPSIGNGSSVTNSSGQQQLLNGTSSHNKICSSMSTSATSTSSKSSIGSQQNGISNGSMSASSSSNNQMSGSSSKVNQQHLLNNQQHPEVTITSTTCSTAIHHHLLPIV